MGVDGGIDLGDVDFFWLMGCFCLESLRSEIAQVLELRKGAGEVCGL